MVENYIKKNKGHSTAYPTIKEGLGTAEDKVGLAQQGVVAVGHQVRYPARKQYF